MRAVIQRVSGASVSVDDAVVSSIETGLLVLIGIAPEDTEAEARRLAAKVVALRIFEDADGKMNLSCADVGGTMLCVSQFTLYGDVRRGNRPSFEGAARPEVAQPLYEAFCSAVEAAGIVCRRGVFGAHMSVELTNDGPVTLIIDTQDLLRPRKDTSAGVRL